MIRIHGDSPYVPGQRVVIGIEVISWAPNPGSLPLVTAVTGAPPGLTYDWGSMHFGNGEQFIEHGYLEGVLPSDLRPGQNFHVTVTADDRTYPPVSRTFTMTIAGGARPEPSPAAPAWFSPDLYDALVYNAFDRKHDGGGRPGLEGNARVLDRGHAANVNVVFNPEGFPDGSGRRCSIPGSSVRLLARRTGDAIRAVTGGSWSGRTAIVTDDDRGGGQYEHGWIRVSFEGKLFGEPGTGEAGVGGPDGPMRLFINDDCSFVAPNILGAYLRELGHVLGFFHVPESSWLMHRTSTRGWYAPNELLHMRKAYELGRHYPRNSPVWSLRPPGPSPGRRPPRQRGVD